MRVVVLAVDSTSTWMVVNALRSSYPSLQVALEKPISRLRLLRNRLRRLGIARVLGQLLFMLYLPLLRRRSYSQATRLINKAGLSSERPADLVVAEFESVNSDACQAWLRQLNADVVVVNGTRILSSQILASCSAVFLNTHCGITPAYRGVHGAYWALAMGDANHAGVTVHAVDAGIDTGDIAFQSLIEIGPEDNFTTYPVRQYVAAIPLLDQAIRGVRAGTLQLYRRDDLSSDLWSHPTLWQYLYNRLRRGVR